MPIPNPLYSKRYNSKSIVTVVTSQIPYDHSISKKQKITLLKIF